MKILIIDNYDSFTFNLYQLMGEIVTESAHYNRSETGIFVKRNDEITLNDIKKIAPDKIIISPGPGNPKNKAYFGVCEDVISQLGKHIPILGVCLGMQGIASCFGGEIVAAKIPMHGKVSTILHDNQSIFKDLPQQLEVMRYHSLKVSGIKLPTCLSITSITHSTDVDTVDFKQAVDSGQEEIMGIRHLEYPIEGIQFHPESFATEGSKAMLKNFIDGPY